MPERLRTPLLVLIALVFARPFVPVSAEATDPLIGMWILNVEKTVYEGLSVPTSGFRTFDYTLDGMILVTKGTDDGKGHRTATHFLARFDGKDYPEFTRGQQAPIGTVALKRSGPYAGEIIAKQNGKVYMTGSWTISKDAKTLTWTLKSTDAEGKPTVQARVYEKQ